MIESGVFTIFEQNLYLCVDSSGKFVAITTNCAFFLVVCGFSLHYPHISAIFAHFSAN